jgi:hypothetical protein
LLTPDGTVEIRLFQKIEVQITVTDAGENQAQRSKLVLKLISPRIDGMVPTSLKSNPPIKKKQRTNK